MAIEGASNANSIINQIRIQDQLQQSDLVGKKSAAESVGSYLGELLQAEDVKPSHLNEARTILDRLTQQESPNGGLLGKLKQFVSDLRGASSTFSKVELPTNRSGLESLKAAAHIAAVPYTGVIPEGLSPNPPTREGGAGLTSLVSAELALSDGKSRLINKGDTSKGEIIDPRSGLAANLLVDEKRKEIHVVFGGTTSGLEKTDNFNKRSSGNFASTLSQWVSNLKTALGIQSHSLQQAKELTRLVVDTAAASEKFANFEIKTVGHSKGSSEAVYAALSQEKPLKATGFSSADLSGKLVRSLPAANVEAASELVTNFHVKGDLVPNLRYVSPAMRPLGSEAVVPANGAAGPLGRHDEFVKHIDAFVDAQLSNLD